MLLDEEEKKEEPRAVVVNVSTGSELMRNIEKELEGYQGQLGL